MTSAPFTEDTHPNRATVSAAQAVDIYEAALKTGLSAEQIENATGISREIFTTADARISAPAFKELWKLYTAESADPSCGLKAGKVVRHRSMGVLGHLVMASENLGQALTRCLRYYGLLSEIEAARLEELDHEHMIYSFHCLEPAAYCRPMLDRSLSAALAWAETFTGQKIRLAAVHLQNSPPAHVQLLKGFFRVRVVNHQPSNGIVFSRRLLELPGVSSNDYLSKILESRARSLHSTLDSQSNLEQRLRHTISLLLPDGEAGSEAAAAELGIGKSALYRALKKNNLTYKTLLEDQRRRLSRYYLDECRFTKTETALMLGYSELSAFLRAQRRWSE